MLLPPLPPRLSLAAEVFFAPSAIAFWEYVAVIAKAYTPLDFFLVTERFTLPFQKKVVASMKAH